MYEHEHGTIVHGSLESILYPLYLTKTELTLVSQTSIFIANGRAKLTNSACAFQYVAQANGKYVCE
jgi:hypothetical protein